MTVRNGVLEARSRVATYTPKSSTARAMPSAVQPGQRTGPGGPNASATVAPTSRTPAAASEPKKPSRWGSPRTPVRASSARSGSTFTKCAPAPSRPPASTSQTGGILPAPNVVNAGRQANDTAYGTTENTVDLSGQSYSSADT